MSTVLGVALAAIVGTSPLAEVRAHVHDPLVLTSGFAGLFFLFVTLFLIMQVMRPQSVSFADVQFAKYRPGIWQKLFLGNALYEWKMITENEQDLNLPCGIRSLDALREAMIVEEITLVALSRAAAEATGRAARQTLAEAQDGRAARLIELRIAAAKIATVGEYYKLLFRNTWATYAGSVCALLGTALIIAAFMG
jgi:hypothetical protein